MKSPSKSISKSLASQTLPGRNPEPTTATRQRQAGLSPLPGSGEVHPGVGAAPRGSAKRQADAAGQTFGGPVSQYAKR